MNPLNILSTLLSVLLVAITTNIHTLTIWIIFSLVAISLGIVRHVNERIDSQKRSIIPTSFSILTICGCILNLDNINNFGTVFGYAVDDERYFNTIKLLVSGSLPKEYGLFEIIVASIAFLFHKTVAPNFTLTDLLPINWFLGSLVCYLCQLLAFRVSDREVPAWVIYVSLLLNFHFVDAFIRLYREALLYLFYTYALLLVYENKYIKSAPFILASAAIRGSNGYFLFMFAGLNLLRQRIYNNAIFLATIVMITVFSFPLIYYAGGILLNYSSDLGRTERYREAFADYSFEDRLELRQESLVSGIPGKAITHRIYNTNYIISILAKPAISFFFPLTLRPLRDTRISHSPHATTPIANDGLFIFHIIVNIMILNWIIVFPLFAIGFYACLFCRDKKQTFALFFLIILALVSEISGQMRHGIAFFVFVPSFVVIGFSLCRSSTMARHIAFCLGFIMFISIFALNGYKYY
jgi:hypothetical protein